MKAKLIRENSSDSYASGVWDALDKETDVTTGKAPLVRVTSPHDAKDMEVLLDWLRWRILSKNADARFSYAYAANLYYMIDSTGKSIFPMDAAVFFFQARLALAIDGARCVDKSSPQGIALAYESQKYLQPLVDYVNRIPKRERSIAILEATSLEKLRGERPALGSLCTRGLKTMLQTLNAGSQPVQQSSEYQNTVHSPGKAYAVDTSGLAAELIPEDEWRIKRREIIENYIQNSIDNL